MKHKRLLSCLTAALTCLTVTAIPAVPGVSFGISASADGDLGEFVTAYVPMELCYGYYENSDEIVILRYIGYDYNYTIPSSIDGRTVTEIGPNAFSNKSFLNSVTIPDTVTYIGELAFYNNTMRSVSIPDSVEFIADYAFAKSGLTSVSIPASVDTVGSSAFWDCLSLQTVTIAGNAELGEDAFYHCPVLRDVQIAAGCTTKPGFAAFANDPALVNVNGAPAYTMQPDAAGISQPVLNPNIHSVVRNVFSQGTHIGFVDSYCTAVCNYVAATETADWMNDALKARQMHDWLIRHCEPEDEANGEKFMDLNNHVASSVFLSAATNVRGAGIGESVCVGYAKAFTMLLSAAGVESYTVSGCPCIGKGGCAWNAVQINGTYYECDVAADDAAGTVSQYRTNYTHFLKKDAEMKALHNYTQGSTNMYSCASEHELLGCYTGSVLTQLAQCAQSYLDDNHDGILDYDYNLSGVNLMGTDFLQDSYALSFMMNYIYPGYNMFQINDLLDETFYFWHYQQHTSFADFIFDYYGCQH